MTTPKQNARVVRLVLVVSIIVNLWLGFELHTAQFLSAEQTQSINLLNEQLRREREANAWQAAIDQIKSKGEGRQPREYESH